MREKLQMEIPRENVTGIFKAEKSPSCKNVNSLEGQRYVFTFTKMQTFDLCVQKRFPLTMHMNKLNHIYGNSVTNFHARKKENKNCNKNAHRNVRTFPVQLSQLN